ncbi:hypothetical protein MMC09_004115 [Bachmanniomyces sp. S44760]|nr:hypothetical protein [Bachmanniomyces sp. S44760]
MLSLLVAALVLPFCLVQAAPTAQGMLPPDKVVTDFTLLAATISSNVYDVPVHPEQLVWEKLNITVSGLQAGAIARHCTTTFDPVLDASFPDRDVGCSDDPQFKVILQQGQAGFKEGFSVHINYPGYYPTTWHVPNIRNSTQHSDGFPTYWSCILAPDLTCTFSPLSADNPNGLYLTSDPGSVPYKGP